MFSSNIGFIHTVCATIAVVIGGVVAALPKGTRVHRRLGYGFVIAMVLMNVTALFTQAIYQFGPFHWLALGSLFFVILGVSAPLFLRNSQGWLRLHYDFMLWSYVGLIAAMFSEIAVRVPAVGLVIGGGALFWMLVISASVATFVVGGYLIGKYRKHYFAQV